VTNALDNGVVVEAGTGGIGVATSAETDSAAGNSATGNWRTGFPPIGVGVWYCPHSEEGLAPQDESMKVVRVRKIITRFTSEIIPLMVNPP
jgi:hypothetical protein